MPDIKHPLKHTGETYRENSLIVQAVRDADGQDYVTLQIVNGPSYKVPRDLLQGLEDDFWSFDTLDRAARMAK